MAPASRTPGSCSRRRSAVAVVHYTLAHRMPLAINTDHDKRLIQITASDPLQLADILAFLDTQAETGGWSYRTLSDYSASSWVPEVAEVRQLVRQIEVLATQHGPRGLAAIVTGDERLVNYGMARMYSMLANPNHARIQAFQTVSAALHWLNGENA